MLFNSVSFLIFFPVVVIIYALIPRKLRAVWLLIASYYFYMSWNAKYAILIFISTLVTWAGALFLDKTRAIFERKLALIAVFAVNLGILFLFKYYDFAVATLNRALSLVHVAPVDAALHVLLPVGISFYTFQALGYCVDVYRGDMRAERNLLRYALFVSFFPQLVAGPIERSQNLLTQINDIENKNIYNYDDIVSGLALMLWGLFQKVVIADRIAIVADTVFGSPWRYGATALILGACAFSVQIYCDFGAYSNIAVGAARVMGFRLMNNFDTPYFATGISDFWRRWHISLSTWFRDYLYIPLGGNRKGRVRRYLNLLITFLVSGLWHGAAWTFVAWGGLHGILQILEDLLKKPFGRLEALLHVNVTAKSRKLLRMACTFALVTLAWIFFRAESLTDAVSFIRRMFTHIDPWNLFNGSVYTLGLDHFEAHVLFAALILLLMVDLLRYFRKEELWDLLVRQNLWFRWGVMLALLLGILVYGVYGAQFDSAQFIYFRF
ncbi:MAG: MBOAT family protein [Lachnospiraceae bacterium]|nr:MBOAT family protein [Lachnospiraceae bacterium]